MIAVLCLYFLGKAMQNLIDKPKSKGRSPESVDRVQRLSPNSEISDWAVTVRVKIINNL